MIEYALLLKDATEYSLNGLTSLNPLRKSTTLSGSESTVETTLIERSYGHGAISLGQLRLTSQDLSLTMEQTFESDTAFKTFNNGLIYALMNAQYLIDKTNNVRTKIVVSTFMDNHEEGSFDRIVTFEIVFTQLTPFWESLTAVNVSASLLAGITSTIDIANIGSMEVPPLITISVVAPCDTLSLLVTDTEEGTIIESSLFGTTIYTTMVLDNDKGTLVISNSDHSIEQTDINSFAEGMGFFNIPNGNITLEALSSVNASLLISFKPRYYR